METINSSFKITNPGLLFFIFCIMYLYNPAFAAEKNSYLQPLIGKWEGRCYHFASQESVSVSITINEDATVEGTVGDAVLKKCLAKKNRGWIGRWVNIKTDYIVRSGYLEGLIAPGDSIKLNYFTLPFNFSGTRMQGTVMKIAKWTYPLPLVKIDLKKVIE